MFEKRRAKRANERYEAVVRANNGKAGRKDRKDPVLKPKNGEFDDVQNQ